MGFRNLQEKLENEVLTIPGRDYQHSLEMQKILKHRIKSIDVFLLLFSGATTRYVLENLQFLSFRWAGGHAGGHSGGHASGQGGHAGV